MLILTILEILHFHPRLPTDHCRLASIFHQNVRRHSKRYVQICDVWRCIKLKYMYLGETWHFSLTAITLKMFFIQSSAMLQMLPWEVRYVYKSVWHLKSLFCESIGASHMLRLWWTSDTVFWRKIDSRRQWGHGISHSDSFPHCIGVYMYANLSLKLPFFLHAYVISIGSTVSVETTTYCSSIKIFCST